MSRSKRNSVPTSTQEYAVSLYNEGKDPSKISQELNIAVHTVNNILKRFGIKRRGCRKYFVDETFFETIDSEHKAYWLGFLYADGYIRKRENKTGEVKLKLGLSDYSHIEKFRLSMGSNSKISLAFNKTPYKGSIVTSICAFMSIYSNKITNDLINLGCVQNKSFIIRFPQNIPPTLIKDFIRGFFDGDGSIFSNSANSMGFYICCASYPFLETVQKIFSDSGIDRSFLRTVTRDNIWYLKVHNVNDIKKLHHYFYDSATVFLDRKKNKFDLIYNMNGKS